MQLSILSLLALLVSVQPIFASARSNAAQGRLLLTTDLEDDASSSPNDFLFPILSAASEAAGASASESSASSSSSSPAVSSSSSSTSPLPSATSIPRAAGGRFQQFTAQEACRVARMPLFLHPDRCLVPRMDRLFLGSPAVCANGTEARFEMYRGPACFAGEADAEVVRRYGGKKAVKEGGDAHDAHDSNDSPLNQCLDVSRKTSQVRSVAWVCNGVPVDEGDRKPSAPDRGGRSRGGGGAGRVVGTVFGVLVLLLLVAAGAVLVLHRPTREFVQRRLLRRDGAIRL